ncbi:MAG: hypothetical protein AB7L65_01495 [Hyphomonadaceae bacterium]
MTSAEEINRLANRIRAAAGDDGLIEAAQVRLLGLDQVRAAAGARWPRMREYVREGSVKIIAQHIGDNDAVVPCGDGFLVVFAEGTPEQTQHRCTEINEALIRFYLGEQALAGLGADVRRAATSRSDLANLASNDFAPSADQGPRYELNLGRFWPVWSARHQGVAAHLCGPVIEAQGAERRLGYDVEFVDTGCHRQSDFLELDLCLFEQAVAAAIQPGTGPVGVTVHISTLRSARTRAAYLKHIAATASHAAQRMFVMIAEIEPGTPLISLSEWTAALKHTIPRVSFDLHHSDHALGALGSTGAWAAGYHLPMRARRSTISLRSALRELDSWCRTLNKQGVQPFVNGFVESPFLDLASYSDLAFATGEKLWPSQQTPNLKRAQLAASEASDA